MKSMKQENRLAFLLCLVPLLVSSCVSSIGVKFKPNAEVLQLGKLKSSEYVQHFGKPVSKVSKSNSDGKYELIQYSFTQNNAGTVSSRVLILEFREDVLNGFEFVSSFDQDKTRINLEKVEQVRSGIGKLSDEDILALLGQPSGKALRPTTLEDFKEKIGKGIEIWRWFSLEKVQYNFSNHTDLKSGSIYVIFDSNHKVLDVQTEENNSRSFRWE